MSFEKLFKKAAALTMSTTERKDAHVLIVDGEANTRQTMKQVLTYLGFGAVSDAADHASALQKMQERGVTHVLFDARKTNLSPKEFLLKGLEFDPDLIAIPTSYEPTVDDVFDLLVVGARGYVVKPFNQESLDDAIVMATKGEPLSDSILYAKNRNEALSSLIMTALDKLSVVLRQSEQFETAKAEVPKRRAGFKRAVDIGLTFAQGGHDKLLEAIMAFAIDRAQGPATRLGRLRKRLDDKKSSLERSDQKKVSVEIPSDPS